MHVQKSGYGPRPDRDYVKPKNEKKPGDNLIKTGKKMIESGKKDTKTANYIHKNNVAIADKISDTRAAKVIANVEVGVVTSMGAGKVLKSKAGGAAGVAIQSFAQGADTYYNNGKISDTVNKAVAKGDAIIGTQLASEALESMGNSEKMIGISMVGAGKAIEKTQQYIEDVNNRVVSDSSRIKHKHKHKR